MRLLGWYQVEAKQSTAAILYPAPVRVASICVFPTGAQPFHQSPDIVALTEPEAFFLDVYFNTISVQPTTVQDSQDKRPAPKNVLAPTRIAYAGDQTEFVVDMGLEYATRLIIFNGDFKSMFVAIYGEIATSEPPEVVTYEPKLPPVLAPLPLASSVDPANSSKPTLLAERLLQLLPVCPQLSVATRLIFALKPESEDWDHPDFPNLFSELDVSENSDLESLVRIAGRPIMGDISSEAIATFAMTMHDSLGSNSLDDAYYVAKLLSMAASQQMRFSRTLLQYIDLPEVFNEHTLDETTVFCLRDAAANIEIARYFREDEPFFNSLKDMQKRPKIEKSVQKALKKLLTRIRGWQSFEDALTNASGDFVGSASFLKDISAGEHAIGCWLECMINHDSLASRLVEVPAPGDTLLPPLLFQEPPAVVSHKAFLVFVKALLAVSTVLAALAWADSIGSDQCRERALALLVLWQGIGGYREIVNHCLLLRQITRRLGWNKSDDIPRKLGMHAERLLVGLAKDPQTMLSEDLVTTVLSLEPPFSYITTEELMEIGKLARVARDGLSSAAEELTFTSFRPFSLRRLRVLRVSLAIIAEELTYDDGERHIVESFWSERAQGVGPTLVLILSDIADDLNHHFAVQSPPRMNQTLSELLFRTAHDIVALLTRFTPTYPLISRDLRTLVAAVADLYACADAASSIFSRSSGASLAAQNTRQSCRAMLSILSKVVQGESGIANAQIILRALLIPAVTKAIRDPVRHILQVYDLVMNILPQAPSNQDSTFWATEVFPKVLTEFKAFSHLLAPETRAAFIERLVALDNGEIGIGEWLLVEQMRDLLTTLHRLSSPIQEDHTLILQYQVSSALHFCDLVISSPRTGKWGVSSFSANEDLSQLLNSCLSLILDYNISSLALTRFTSQLAKHANDFAPDVRFDILLLAMRNAQVNPSIPELLYLVPDMLRSLPATSITPERLQSEVGRLISTYSDHSLGMKAETAEITLQILEWVSSQEDVKLTTLVGLSADRFHYLCSNLASVLPAERHTTLTAIKGELIIDEDEVFASPITELPDSLTMPLKAVENLLSSPPTEPPSTPKRGTKTPDILGVVISPPSAILRSPAATGLTKTYLNNDFRQLRQVPSTRMNTSRLPSTHVDEFEHLSQSPELLSAARIDVTGTGSMFQGFMSG